MFAPYTLSAQIAFDDFERTTGLGHNWTVYAGGSSVGIVNGSDIGLVNGPSLIGISGWTASIFSADQYSEAQISSNSIDSVLKQVFVRRRSSDLARYAFHWNNALGGRYELKYDGVPTSQVRILVFAAAPPPTPGDTLRIEIQGMTMKGYLNGDLLLTTTDTAFTSSNPITTTGPPGVTYRFTVGFPAVYPTSVFEWWRGSSLLPAVTSTINIKLILEGFYDAGSNALRKKDFVMVYLRNASSPYSKIDSSIALIDSITLQGSFSFPNTQSGTYYIVTKHRNTIETWSRAGGELFIPSTIMNYNFTDAPGKAFGNNMNQVDASPVRFGIYSGDVDQDEIIDASDAGAIDNDAFNFVTGYVNTDLTGDDIVDASDEAIVDNNAFNFVGVIKP